MSDNPFAEAEVWNVGGEFLPRGDHRCKVLDVEKTKSTNGYPQVIVQVGNEQGSIKDWIVTIKSTVGKVVQLTEALGIGRPAPDQFRVDGNDIELSTAYLNSWKGKEVGVRVGARQNDQNKDEVKGYFPAEKVKQTPASDVTSPEDSALFAPAGVAPTNATLGDDDIPF
jgi:hypothetical protein